MSKEFEELVLKKLEKLDVLDERTLNTDKKLEEVSEELKNTKAEVKVLSKKMEDTQAKVKDLSKKMDNTQENVKELTNKFTVFDYEINNKIDTLFDAFTVNQEKDLVHEKDIDSLNQKVFDHDIRISNLEDKVLTA